MVNDFLEIDGGICAALGFKANGVHCGLRRSKRHPDLALIVCEDICEAAAVYTQNKVKGAPIQVTKAHLENSKAQAVIINSGNANTCNKDGEAKAALMCELAAKELKISPDNVVVASTGIIGETLPIEPIQKALSKLAKGLSREGNLQAREAILTTDTCEKETALSFYIGTSSCHLGGMAKGSGMIHPNMATMLCFLTTDVNISSALLQKALSDITDVTFNMVSVDGDTSTNDMALLMTSKKAGNAVIEDEASEEYQIFKKALSYVMENLSKKIAKDGEGATKLLECRVSGAVSQKDARAIAKSVITSSLFKSAMFGQDPNWGRILCAVGYAEAEVNIDRVEVLLCSHKGEICVCKEGRGVKIDRELACAVLTADEIIIRIKLSDGNGEAVAWGCDLTYNYIKINADYHT